MVQDLRESEELMDNLREVFNVVNSPTHSLG